jgi:hypothetical protein
MMTSPDDVPADMRTYAEALRCSDCDGRASVTGQDDAGNWRLTMVHQPTCPRLRIGRTDTAALVTAAQAMAAAVDQPTELTVTDLRGQRT